MLTFKSPMSTSTPPAKLHPSSLSCSDPDISEYISNLEESIRIDKEVINDLASVSANVEEKCKGLVLSLNRENAQLQERLKESFHKLNAALQELADTKRTANELKEKLNNSEEKYGRAIRGFHSTSLINEVEKEVRKKCEEEHRGCSLRLLHSKCCGPLQNSSPQSSSPDHREPEEVLRLLSNDPVLARSMNKANGRGGVKDDECKMSEAKELQAIPQEAINSISEKFKREFITNTKQMLKNELKEKMQSLEKKVASLEEAKKQLEQKVMQLQNSNTNMLQLNLRLSDSLEILERTNKKAESPPVSHSQNKRPLRYFTSKSKQPPLRRKTDMMCDIETSFII